MQGEHRVGSGMPASRSALDGAGRRSIFVNAATRPWLAREGSSRRDDQRGTKMERTIGKIRVYEIARQLGMTTDEVLGRLRARGEPVTSASSTVHGSVAEALMAKVRAERTPPATPAVAVRHRPDPVPTAGSRARVPPG